MNMQTSPDDSMQATGMGGQPQQEHAADVKQMASQAGEKLMDTAEQQKRAGADFMTGIASAVRRAAGEFDGQVPQAAHYIRSAADQMETMSDALRRRDIGQMLSDVQSFARRQPSAFLGASFLAGFAMVRFLRSSASDASSSARDSWEDNLPEDSGRYGAPAPDMANSLPGSAAPRSGL